MKRKTPIDNEIISRRIAAAKLLRKGYQRFRAARLEWRLAREDAMHHLGPDDAKAFLRTWTEDGDRRATNCGGHDPHIFGVLMRGDGRAEE